jgi:ribosomal protein L11 methyltransferase
MKRATLWKTSVTTTAEAEDAVAELMARLIAPGPSAYTDVETGTITVSAYSPRPPANRRETLAAVKAGLRELKRYGLDVGRAQVRLQKLPRENWADSWKRHFQALEIGPALLVKPSWIRRKLNPGQKLVVLDPGLSFGTGQHPTTGFCLREIARHTPATTGGKSFLDMGTGSGILAIAATKLRFGPVDAFDFDAQCVQVARANARRNRVLNKIKITQADLTKLPRRAARRYDLVCANLLADLLLTERDRILARVKPEGTLVVAGILKREFSAVHKAYASAGWRLAASRAENEWRSGSFVRANAIG